MGVAADVMMATAVGAFSAVGLGARVIVGDGRVSSDDRDAWFQAVVDGAHQVRSGRMITPLVTVSGASITRAVTTQAFESVKPPSTWLTKPHFDGG